MAESGDAALIDAFCDALWLEHGLSKNTLEAYRRDLTGAAAWLSEHAAGLLLASEQDLRGYIHARHESSKPSTANRRMSALRRFLSAGAA